MYSFAYCFSTPRYVKTLCVWYINILVSIVPHLNWFRSCHRSCSVKKVFLKICEFHRNTPVFESLFNKVAGLRRLQHRCFLVKFAKFLRTTILKKICE